MNAASILREARRAGLRLEIAPSGRLGYSGPIEVFERFKPTLVQNRAEVLVELRREAEEVDRLMNWWREPVEGWRDGHLEIRNIVTNEVTRVNLREGEQ